MSTLSPAPTASDRSVVISIHDVSPVTWQATQTILERLEGVGARNFSLLVVPDHHKRGHFLDDPEFCGWMKHRMDAGDEIVIHGYYHLRNRRPEESFKEKVTTRIYTAGEGEFYDISGADAMRIVSEARQDFRKIGIDPQGFIAPAWLLSEPAEIALRKLGFAYTTRLATVTDLACEREYTSQSLVWSVRSFWRCIVSRIWNSSLYKRLQPLPLLRIGIHPVDVKHSAIWEQIEALSIRALADREPVTYLRWIETSRTAAHVNVLQS